MNKMIRQTVLTACIVLTASPIANADVEYYLDRVMTAECYSDGIEISGTEDVSGSMTLYDSGPWTPIIGLELRLDGDLDHHSGLIEMDSYTPGGLVYTDVDGAEYQIVRRGSVATGDPSFIFTEEGGTTFFFKERIVGPEMLSEHNDARDEVGVPHLSWSDNLAVSAREWAEDLAGRDCILEHSGPGENLYWSSSSSWSSPSSVVGLWEAEKEHYDLETNTCEPGEVCGHYTQMIWSSTELLGCGRAKCDDGRGQIWACHYRPYGNWSGKGPLDDLND